MIDATTPMRLYDLASSRPVASLTRLTSASTDSLPFLNPLERLLTARNEHGYTFQPSIWAYKNMRRFLESASAILGSQFPLPRFVPDGEGGIDAEWDTGRRELTLSCRGSANQTDFIYWEENGTYQGDTATLDLLLNKLEWLTA